MKVHRVASLTTLAAEASQALEDYSRWPDVEARAASADRAVDALREGLRGYDFLIVRAIMLAVIADMLELMDVRDSPRKGMQLALMKAAHLLEPVPK